ncbi:right-handed parallel beta-helix repeat-containing protein [Nonomuraea sp. NPDC004580]|uniref:right-handed parallel beta-helix repeat-containing protein n=1 Tax=Nonomuraea sp. NPDC004580 TaxID=3154552 RepID=UPI0033B0581F
MTERAVVEVVHQNGAQNERAIQRALDEVAGSGGGRVIVGPGEWELRDAPLRVHAGTRLTLTPATRIVRTGPIETMLINGPYGGRRTVGAHDGPGDIVVEGGLWDVHGFANPRPAFGMVFNHARNVQVRDLEIRNMPEWHAIETNSTYNVTISGCRFVTGIAREPHAYQTEAVSLDLAAPGLTAWGAEDDTHTSHVRVIDNFCSGYPTFVGCHTGHPRLQHSSVVIANNTATDLSCWAVNLTNTSAVSITGNAFTRTAAGIRIRTGGDREVAGVAITGNVVSCTGGPAVHLDAGVGGRIVGTVVSGNSFSSPALPIIERTGTIDAVLGPNAPQSPVGSGAPMASRDS